MAQAQIFTSKRWEKQGVKKAVYRTFCQYKRIDMVQKLPTNDSGGMWSFYLFCYSVNYIYIISFAMFPKAFQDFFIQSACHIIILPLYRILTSKFSWCLNLNSPPSLSEMALKRAPDRVSQFLVIQLGSSIIE